MRERRRQIVAYFDFDGTISSHDTLIPFLVYTVGKLRFIAKLPYLMVILLRYWLRFITNEKAKQLTLISLIRGKKIYFLEEKAKGFALTKLNKYIKPEVYAKVEWHREQGHTLVLVSANLAIYLRYWVELHKLDYVIATEIEFDEYRRATGKLLTRNCYGKEKVLRIEQFLKKNKLNFSYSYAYGNSAGDNELLAYVNEPFYVSGNDVARLNGQ